MNKEKFLVILSLGLATVLVGLVYYGFSEINRLKNELKVAQDKNVELMNIQNSELDQLVVEGSKPEVTPLGTAEPSKTPEQVMVKVKLYYKNTKKDPAVMDCNADEFVYRDIPLTKTPLKDSITLLLTNELTPQEKQAGLINQFETPPGDDMSGLRAAKAQLKLVSASITNGVATLKFEDPGNFTSGGSCRVGIMQEQIKQTAKQFPSVKEVIFLPDLLFQP